jgi:5-methylcytosine-specific restriction endonuclease McrA
LEHEKGYSRPDILRRGNTQSVDEAYINRIKAKYSRFEYAGGWKNDNAYFFCKDCGSFFKHNTKNTRPSSHQAFTCPKCLKVLLDVNERERKELNKIKQGQERDEKHRQKMLAMSYTQMSFSVCPICNGVFVSSKRNKKYCSDSCQKASTWKGKEAYRYIIPLKELYERDNGICYLCGGKCDYSDKKIVNGHTVYGNMYPSRDHIYPKSQGGSHTWENIKLAHRICNSLKGSKLTKIS